MHLALRCALLLSALAASDAWLAVTPIDKATLSVDVFQMANNGSRQRDVLTIPVTAGEELDGNAFTCGRCFCLMLTNNRATTTSYLYNMSFCLVPTPKLESKLTVPNAVAYNLHSNRGEGDGGAGYTVLIDHAAAPAPAFVVARLSAAGATRLVDISRYVDADGGGVYPGGTAYCADSSTMWVAVLAGRGGRPQDTLVTVDLASGAVVSNISLTSPALAAHFASCGAAQVVGGVNQVSGGGGTSTVQIGTLSPSTGAFTVFDKATLPKAQASFRLAPIAVGIEMPQWENSYAAALYDGDFALPGLLFVSTGGSGGSGSPATLSPLQDAVVGVADEY
jgi:hypothetical protein